jgi:hypothetical protein
MYKIGFLANFHPHKFLESDIFIVFGTRNHFNRLFEQHSSYQPGKVITP